jgi:outer membrane protein assembly factor BamB
MHSGNQRRALGRLSLALAVLAAGVGADWPQFLGPTRNGVSPEEGAIPAWPKKGPKVLWRRDVGEGFSGPVVAGGALVLVHRVGDDEVVECLDAVSGKPRWKFAYRTAYADMFGKGDGPRATPLIAAGRVFSLGAEGMLTCLSLKDGKKLWQRNLLGDYDVPASYFGVGTSPLLEGKRLLVNVGGRGAGIVAFDRDTGKELWKATDDPASYASPIAATVDGVRHALFFTRTGLVSVDPATGKVRFRKRWRARIDASVNAATPVLLEGGRLFLTASYDTGAVLLRLKKDGVTEVWKSNRVLSSHYSTPVAVGPRLYGFEGRQEEGASLRCIDWADGTVRWTEPGFGCGSIVAAGGSLIVLSEDGDLVLVEPGDKYREKARASVLGKPCRAHPAYADGRLYARDGRRLVCWELRK